MTTPGPASPCISVCVLDEGNCCKGCRRTVAEIARWGRMGAVEQWAVIARIEQRRAAEARETSTAIVVARG
jgi:predicted Fe-S protein YdhL (DUF1289 family)